MPYFAIIKHKQGQRPIASKGQFMAYSAKPAQCAQQSSSDFLANGGNAQQIPSGYKAGQARTALMQKAHIAAINIKAPIGYQQAVYAYIAFANRLALYNRLCKAHATRAANKLNKAIKAANSQVEL